MRRQNIPLPSGAIVAMRQLMVKEENHLASASRSRRAAQDKVLVEIVSMCSEGFVETGPYSWAAIGGEIKWKDMLAGDMLAAMLGLRKLSYREGAQYDINIKCPSRVCNHKFTWAVNLDTDLALKTIPKPSFDAFLAGKPMSVEIAGQMVHFNLQMVKDAEFQEKLERQFPGREMACSLRTRIAKVDGIDSKDLMNWLDGLGKGPHEGLTSDEAEDLRAAFVEADCGIDTEVEIECPRSLCRNVFAIDLPFDGIFSPGRAQAKRKEIRSGAPQSED